MRDDVYVFRLCCLWPIMLAIWVCSVYIISLCCLRPDVSVKITCGAYFVDLVDCDINGL